MDAIGTPELIGLLSLLVAVFGGVIGILKYFAKRMSAQDAKLAELADKIDERMRESSSELHTRIDGLEREKVNHLQFEAAMDRNNTLLTEILSAIKK